MTSVPEMLQRLEQAVQTFPAVRDDTRDGHTTQDSLALALCDVAGHFGTSIHPLSLVSGMPLVDGRLPLEHVETAALRASLIAEPGKGNPARLRDYEHPTIALKRDGIATVVWSVERDRRGRPVCFLVSDGGASRQRTPVAVKDFAREATGRIIRVRPAAGEDERVSQVLSAGTGAWFLPAMRANATFYAEALAATVAINMLALALPLFTMNIYDRVLPNAAVETLWSLAIGVMLAAAFDFLLKILRSYFVDAAGRRADIVLGNFIYGRLLGARLQPASAPAGVRASTMREIDTLREFYNSATLTALGDLPFALVFIAMIGVVAGPLVLVSLAAIPIMLAIAWITQRAVGKLVEASIRQSALKSGVLVETIAGLESIKASGAESWAASEWEKTSAEGIRIGEKIKSATNFGINAVYLSQTLTQILMIIVGFYMATAGLLTSGGLIAATMLAGRAMQPLSQMALLIAKLHQVRQSFRMLDDIVSMPQERAAGTSFVGIPALSGAISFETVSFCYDKSAPPVLKDVSFALAAGEKVGLIGGIGTGKSTVLKLVTALQLPDSGRVLIDGIPAGHLDPAVLRSEIGMALQQGDLFHGTIRSNIALADPNVDHAALLEAAHVAGALDWIVKLPRGLDTPVRERGAGLSAGQRQTLVLARALLRKPKILLLDEPTSDLDPNTEQIVVERLRGWLAGKSAIIVTHRPAMLGLVDRLIVLDGGRKRHDGPKATVLSALAAGARGTAARGERRA